jgi:hypothetical protein
VQYLDPLSAQLVQPSFTHLMAGLGIFIASTENDPRKPTDDQHNKWGDSEE